MGPRRTATVFLSGEHRRATSSSPVRCSAAYACVAVAGVLERSRQVGFGVITLAAGLFGDHTGMLPDDDYRWIRRNPELRALATRFPSQATVRMSCGSGGRRTTFVVERDFHWSATTPYLGTTTIQSRLSRVYSMQNAQWPCRTNPTTMKQGSSSSTKPGMASLSTERRKGNRDLLSAKSDVDRLIIAPTAVLGGLVVGTKPATSASASASCL